MLGVLLVMSCLGLAVGLAFFLAPDRFGPLAGAVAAALAACLIWWRLRGRVFTPPWLWIVLLVYAAFNLLVGAVLGAMYAVLMGHSKELSAALMSGAGVAPPSHDAMWFVYGPWVQSLVIGLAFALRRPGPVTATRTGRRLLWGYGAALVLLAFVGSLLGLRIVYTVTLTTPIATAVDAGGRVKLVDGREVVVPPGWRAEVDRYQGPPPAWLLLDPDLTSDLEQVVTFRSSADHGRAADASMGAGIAIWRAGTGAHSGPRLPGTAPLVLGPGLRLTAETTATVRTTATADGWKSLARVVVPDTARPYSVWVMRRESRGSATSREEILLLLSTFWFAGSRSS